MFSIKKWMMAAVGIVFCLILSISVAQAEPFDITFCGSTTITQTVLESKELTITTFEGKGAVRSNPENKAFDNCSYHLLGVSLQMADKVTNFGYSRYMDSDGDFFITEASADSVPMSAQESSFKFLLGTGKWKGISGGGKSKFIFMTRGKQQINPTTFQGYLKMIGNYELPKK